VPRANELAQQQAALEARAREREEKDFRARNARAVIEAPGRSADVDPAAPLPKRADYGTLPAYLRERKEGWAAAAAAKERADKDAEGCPPGHKLMPDDERLETLELLRGSLAEAHDLLSKMPLRVEILSAVRRKAELEAKVAKLEDAVKVFSRQKVFVKG
jgi:hypothetical protein